MPIFKTEDAELFYEDIGPGEPVLLLHGPGGSTAGWAPQIEALAPRYRVLALDARGSGHSRDLQHPAGPFSVKQFADDVAPHHGPTSASAMALMKCWVGDTLAMPVGIPSGDNATASAASATL